MGFIVMCMVACLCAGAGLAFGLTHASTPTSLKPSSNTGNLPLSTEHFDDERTITVKVSSSQAQNISFGKTGQITQVVCPTDGIITSGSREYDMDGTPLVTLYTETPLYRDLSFGDKGSDVEALQNELIRLGYGTSQTEIFDWNTWDAWRRFYAEYGGVVQEKTFDRTLVIWIPAESLATTGCIAKLGSTVSDDSVTAAFTTVEGILSIKATALPTDRLAGERVVEIKGREYPIDDDGNITDQEALQAMNSWDGYTGNRKDGEQTTDVSVSYRLKQAIDVYSVPAESLVGLTQSDGCVVSGKGTVRKIHVVGSSLGRTLITLTGKPPSSIQANPRKTSCDAH
ncbi:peptidoglycan-binding domain-containing protein [Bifidobacterium catenulatum]